VNTKNANVRRINQIIKTCLSDLRIDFGRRFLLIFNNQRKNDGSFLAGFRINNDRFVVVIFIERIAFFNEKDLDVRGIIVWIDFESEEFKLKQIKYFSDLLLIL
jgi:hypothetical protein